MTLAKLGTVNGQLVYADVTKLGAVPNDSSWEGAALLYATQGEAGGPPQSGLWTITGSQAWADGTSDLLYMASTTSFVPTNATDYRMVFDIVSYSSGGVYPVFGSTVVGGEVDGVGHYEFNFTASAGTSSKVHGLQASALNAYIDNFQIYDVDDTLFQYTYIYQGSDIPVYAVLFNLAYRERRLTGLSLSNNNQSIPIIQRTDRVYRNP